jgi:hypothetical protein
VNPPFLDELLVAPCHTDLDGVVPLGLEGRVVEAEFRSDLADLHGRLEDVGTVLGPEPLDGRAAFGGVRLRPLGYIAVGQVLRADLDHGFSLPV